MGGGGQGLYGSLAQQQKPDTEKRRRPTRSLPVRIARDETADDDNNIGVGENPIEDRSPPVSPPAMSDEDDYVPLAKKSSNSKKATMGPKSKRKGAPQAAAAKNSPLEAANHEDEDKNGDGDASEPESSPVKSKDPFQIANDAFEDSDEDEDDDDDMALTSIIGHSVGGPRGSSGGGGPKSKVQKKESPKPAAAPSKPRGGSSNGFSFGSGGPSGVSGGSDPFAAINDDEVNGNDGYGGDDQAEEDFLNDLLNF